MKTPLDRSSIEMARDIFHAAIESLQETVTRLDYSFEKAVNIIKNHSGKVIVCGVGKSGYVARKIAASFCSIGMSSVFLDPNEALHGDLGVYDPGDPTIVFSKSGSTAEIVRLMPILKQFRSPIIAIIGNNQSPIAKYADIILDVSIRKEGDCLGIVPTTSILVSMAMADALVSAVMFKRSLTKEDFAKFHPAGQLGRNLLYTVGDVMHSKDYVACLETHNTFKEALIAMTRFPLGAACVVDKSTSKLLGLITDGDIRRALLKYSDIHPITVQDIMVSNPTVIDPGCLLGQAVELMENHPDDKKISLLPVVDQATNIFVGIIRLHDVYQPH